MERNFPSQLLNILSSGFKCHSRVLDGTTIVHLFPTTSWSQTRRGTITAFFVIFIDDVVMAVQRTNVSCYISSYCVSIFFILIAPSVEGLQKLLTVCEEVLDEIDMQINVKKSKCLRFGARHNCNCADLTLQNGERVDWVDSCRYLGVYLVSAPSFRCSFHEARASLNKAFNGIFGKVGRYASEDAVLSLVASKCLPVLLYATEVCPLLSRDLSSISFALTRVLMKNFFSR